MSVIKRRNTAVAPGRGGIPLNPEDEEEEEGDDPSLSGVKGNSISSFGLKRPLNRPFY